MGSIKELAELYYNVIIEQDDSVREFILLLIETKYISSFTESPSQQEQITSKIASKCIQNVKVLNELRGTSGYFSAYQKSLHAARNMKARWS